ncbi:HTH-type transcriptional regulator MgrA [Pigmentiphaga humi]|uniref:HTH-type transcriptional regulator MgrA n=1 Tax=Pigmentiphaga humi TaxID=2478468 RepID=A0A3P4B3A9_9BURK|nr:MarR family transcriptional regulator [Pigmentiphaga humi]VCU70773.1 HTH-type transcriptional regulator MgrA [Pigmentiphaga humi]
MSISPQKKPSGPPPARHGDADDDNLPYMSLPRAQRDPKAGSDIASLYPSHPVGAEIRLTHLLFKSALHQRFRTHKVTSAQWAFLRILWNEDGITQKDLAARLGIHATTAVPALAIMERNGYVRRERNGADKRNVYVYLTEAGKALAFDLVPYAAEMNERSLKGISSKDAEKLMKLLWQVQANLKEALGEDGVQGLESEDE